MVIHSQFVFLQMRKTGSTYLTTALKRELTDVRELQTHADWAEIPTEAAGRPVLTFIRNPWDWYVSWYHFNLRRGGNPNGFWGAMSNEGELGFTDTVRKACKVTRTIVGGDLYSSLFRNLVGDGIGSQRLTVGRFESFVDDLEVFLSAVGAQLKEGGMGRIREGSPLNASTHGHYREYYDDELRDVVRKTCRPLIERFGYRF
jgi:hypothetical protein